MCNKPIHADLI